MSSVRFTPLGGACEVGANSYLLEVNGLALLLDAGLHPKKEGLEALPDFSRMPRVPDAAIISHAHVDHCGALPYLLKEHRSVTPYATKPTVRIMDRMLHNSVSVMGILREERHIPEYPLYEHNDVDFAIRRTYGIDMDQPFALDPGSDVRAVFHHAGHVLGSASVRISAPGHEVFYTADICAVDQELMSAFRMPRDAENIDTLIIESTYGANGDADTYSYPAEARRFGRAIGETIRRGGCVLVPAFALGRAQEILNIIARHQEAGLIPDVPVYASGLGRAIYEIYSRYPDHLKSGAVLSPLSQFDRVGDVWDPRVCSELLRRPCIIVATSGMMIENTPSAMIAQHMVKEDRHGIFFVGYCDPDTLGYKLKVAQKGDELAFVLGGPLTKIRLDNIQAFHFSAHAARKDLQRVIDAVRPKNLIFVHGDPDAVRWMHDHTGDGCAKFLPELGKTVELRA